MYGLDKKCIVRGCPVGNKVFRIPLSCIIQWCANLNIDPTFIKQKHRICDLHFDNNCLGTWRLKKGAMPTLNLGHSDGPIYRKTTSSLYEYREKQKHYRHCCVESCNSDNTKYPVYQFPTETWKDIVVIKKEFLNHKNVYICNRHFNTSDVYNTKIKKNALPCMDTGCSNTHISVENCIEKMDQGDSFSKSGIVQESNNAIEEMEIKEEVTIEEFYIDEEREMKIKEEPCIEEFQFEKEHSIREMQIKEENWIEDIKIKEEPCIEEFQFNEEH